MKKQKADGEAGDNKDTKAWNYVRDYSRHCDVNEYIGDILGVRFREYRERWREASELGKILDFPLFLVFETLFKCNLQCVMCLHSSPEKKVYAYDSKLSLDLFRSIMSECASHYCPSITFGGTSEPLLDPELLEMIRLAKKSGFVDIMVNTNATILDADMSRRLIDSGLTRIRIGFDGLTKETYEKIRVGANFEKVRNNIINFMKIKNEMKSSLPIVRVSCVNLLENNREIESFIDFWRPIVDYVSIQVYRPHEFTVDRLKMWPKDNDAVKDVMCTQPFERLYIRGNGDVHACCSVAFGPKIGNVLTTSIYEIWNSDKMHALRNALKSGGWEKMAGCRDCLANARNI